MSKSKMLWCATLIRFKQINIKRTFKLIVVSIAPHQSPSPVPSTTPIQTVTVGKRVWVSATFHYSSIFQRYCTTTNCATRQLSSQFELSKQNRLSTTDLTYWLWPMLCVEISSFSHMYATAIAQQLRKYGFCVVVQINNASNSCKICSLQMTLMTTRRQWCERVSESERKCQMENDEQLFAVCKKN